MSHPKLPAPDLQEYRITGRNSAATFIPWTKLATSWLQWNFRFCGVPRGSDGGSEWHQKIAHGKVGEPSFKKYNDYGLLTYNSRTARMQTQFGEIMDCLEVCMYPLLSL